MDKGIDKILLVAGARPNFMKIARSLGIPRFTLRENTERPVTIDEGTNRLVGTGGEGILLAFEEFRSGDSKKGRVPELWDGKAAERIIRVLLGKAG